MGDPEVDLGPVATDRGVAFAKRILRGEDPAVVLEEAADVFRTLGIAGGNGLTVAGWQNLEDRLWMMGRKDPLTMRCLYPALIYALAVSNRRRDAAGACLRYSLVMPLGTLGDSAADWRDGLPGSDQAARPVLLDVARTLVERGLGGVVDAVDGAGDRQRSGVERLNSLPSSLETLRTTIHQFLDGPVERLTSAETESEAAVDLVVHLNDATVVADITSTVVGNVSRWGFAISMAILDDLLPLLERGARSAEASSSHRLVNDRLGWAHAAALSLSGALHRLVDDPDPMVRHLAGASARDEVSPVWVWFLRPRSMALYSKAVVELVDTAMSSGGVDPAANLVDGFARLLEQLARADLRPDQHYRVLTLGSLAFQAMGRRFRAGSLPDRQRAWSGIEVRIEGTLERLAVNHAPASLVWDFGLGPHVAIVRSAGNNPPQGGRSPGVGLGHG